MHPPVHRPSLLTRKEVAALAGLSVDSIRRNEERLGLDQCKITVNARVIRYEENQAVAALVQVGVIAYGTT